MLQHLFTALATVSLASSAFCQLDPHPFGNAAKDLWIDCAATGNWDTIDSANLPAEYLAYSGSGTNKQIFDNMQAQPRDQVVAFAMYTHDHGVLKVTGQLYPLTSAEFTATPNARLELFQAGTWTEVDTAPVIYPGWTAQFRVESWDNTQDVPYRVRHGAASMYEGIIRHDPVGQDEIVVAMIGCIGTNYQDSRPELIAGVAEHCPDLVYFYGDQHYTNHQHTSPFLEFGRVFKELFRERPVVLICDDHDYNQGNIWGKGGVASSSRNSTQGGFYFDPSYVNMIQRGMTSHLPDPYDATPVAQGIGVYYTRLRCGGVDFSILEDRKWKSGPADPANFVATSDKVTDTTLDTSTLDKPGLILLGQRQLDFLRAWSQDWTGSEMKAVLSQTTFAGVPHIHGSYTGRQVANLDANGWPQTPRNNALRELRRAMAIHLTGDQHLASVVQYGIDNHRDAPYAFTGPAGHNSIFRRWWHPLSETAGPNPRAATTLPWTGDYLDGFQNKITMLAYANPPEQTSLPPAIRGDGYAIIRFKKSDRTIRMECYDRYVTTPPPLPSGNNDPGSADVNYTVAISKNGTPVTTGALITQTALDAQSNMTLQRKADDTGPAMGQTFRTPSGNNSIVSGVSFRMNGSFTWASTHPNMVVKVLKVGDSLGSSSAVGSLANSTLVGTGKGRGANGEAWSLGDWIRFDFSEDLTLEADTDYAIVIWYDDSSTANVSMNFTKVENDQYPSGIPVKGNQTALTAAAWDSDTLAGYTTNLGAPVDSGWYGRDLPFVLYGTQPAGGVGGGSSDPLHLQSPGWPLTVKMMDNDGRQITATHQLAELVFAGQVDPVVQVIEDSSGEILYTVRIQGNSFTPKVYAAGNYTVKVHANDPSDPAAQILTNLPASLADAAPVKRIEVTP